MLTLPDFALSWKRLGAAVVAGLFETSADPTLAVFAFGACSGSSDLRFTPAAALFGVRVVPLVRLLVLRDSGREAGCCGAF